MATRTCFFLSAALSVWAAPAGATSAAAEGATVRQVVIRAPAARVMAATRENAGDDALAKVLWSWVKDGTASVVSDVSADKPIDGRIKARSGREIDWVSEADQDFGSETGIALLTPSAFEKVFVGSSLEVAILEPGEPGGIPGWSAATWHAFFSPCDERSVPWPYWWPETKKTPQVSWYQQKDFFIESVITEAQFTRESWNILGIMPRADCLDPDPKKGQALDVIMAQLNQTKPEDAGKAAAVPSPGAADDPFQGHDPRLGDHRFTVLGFGMNDREAVEMLSGTTAAHGRALLEALLKRLAAGEVKLRLFTSVAAHQGMRATLESHRQHFYPTEMPTIPSAWHSRGIGTRLEIDPVYHEVQCALEFHPAPPRRAEWRCALENPDLFMWQPQFFVREVTTNLEFGDDGAALLGVMRTPECQQGAKGIIPGETLVLMAELEEAGKGEPEDEMPHRAQVELEAIVFDIPAAEGDRWKNPIEGVGDDESYAALMKRTHGQDVKLAAHVVVGTTPGQRAKIGSIEEVITVTEVDPPRDNSPTRYRPTAMERIPCGTTWEVAAILERPEDPFKALGPLEVHVEHTLRHDIEPPHEPNFVDMIAGARNSPTGAGDIPKAVIMEEAWEGKIKLVPGKARFIGVRPPPGDMLKDRLHVAFVRARVTEGREARRADGTPLDPFAPK